MALTIPKVWVDGEILYSNDLNSDIQAIQSYINDYCLVSTDATTTNTASKIVKRDANGDFSARIITAPGTTDSSGFVGDLEGTADLAVNLKGGASGRIPYQTAEDTTEFIEAGTASYLLQSQGAGTAPDWIKPTNNNEVNTIVKRDNSGNFAANTITADLVGNVTGDVTGDVIGDVTGDVTGDVDGKSLSTDALTSTAISAQFQSSLGTNGYQYLPNGFIFQWGLASGGEGSYTVVFPRTFPNACLGVVATYHANAEGNNIAYAAKVRSYSKSQFYIYANSGFFWWAFGY